MALPLSNTILVMGREEGVMMKQYKTLSNPLGKDNGLSVWGVDWNLGGGLILTEHGESVLILTNIRH